MKANRGSHYVLDIIDKDDEVVFDSVDIEDWEVEWKYESIVTIETVRCTVEIPTTSRIVSRAISYMEKQVLESLMKTGERLVAAAEVVESIRGHSSAESVYRQAKNRLKQAETWGKNHDLPMNGLPSAMINVQKKINRAHLSEDDVQDSSAAPREEDKSQMIKWTSELERESLIDELRTLSDDLGRFPKASELRRSDSRCSLRDYHKVFDSWDGALEAAGIDKREALLAEFLNITMELGKIPTTVEMDDHDAYSSSMYYSAFDS